MEVILLEKVHRLGNLGDKVKVKPGYGRNYLIPTKKAVPATEENVAKFEERRAELEKIEAGALQAAQQRAKQLEGLVLTVRAKAGSEGKLFGSVGPADLESVAEEQGVELVRKELRLPGGPLRQIGDYDVDVHLHPDVSATIKVHVISEEGAGAIVDVAEEVEEELAPERDGEDVAEHGAETRQE